MIRTYPCQVIRVVDGDTVVVDIDAGFRISVRHAVRIAGVNAPEMNTVEGKDAKAFVMAWVASYWMASEWPFVLECIGHHPRDKYGRWVGDLLVDDRRLTTALLEANHARVWP